MDQKKLDVDDALKTAQIFRNEGLFEDAKHTLRKLISQFPDELRPRTELQEIQKEELTLILNEVQTGQRRARSRLTPPPRIIVEDSDSIIQKLARDLDLGDVQVEKEPALVLSAEGLSVKDLLDVGIAFLQMGSYNSAAEKFRSVISSLQSQPVEDIRVRELLVSAMELLANTYVEGNHAFDAILFLETALSDNFIPSQMKIGLMYWMGRAHYKTAQKDLAKMWFEEVAKRNPDYRDTDYRLRTLRNEAKR